MAMPCRHEVIFGDNAYPNIAIFQRDASTVVSLTRAVPVVLSSEALIDGSADAPCGVAFTPLSPGGAQGVGLMAGGTFVIGFAGRDETHVKYGVRIDGCWHPEFSKHCTLEPGATEALSDLGPLEVGDRIELVLGRRGRVQCLVNSEHRCESTEAPALPLRVVLSVPEDGGRACDLAKDVQWLSPLSLSARQRLELAWLEQQSAFVALALSQRESQFLRNQVTQLLDTLGTERLERWETIVRLRAVEQQCAAMKQGMFSTHRLAHTTRSVDVGGQEHSIHGEI